MSSHIAKGVFRVVGNLRPGFLKVEYVSRAEPLPTASVAGARIVDVRDDLWIDEVPLNLVPMESRLPNRRLLVTVRDRSVVTDVSAA